MIRMAPRTWDVTVAYHRREGWWDERILRVEPPHLLANSTID